MALVHRLRSWFFRPALTLALAAGVYGLAGCGGTFTGTFEFDGDEFSFKFSLPEIATDRDTEEVDVAGVTNVNVRTRNGSIRVRIDDSLAQAVIRSFRIANGTDETEAEDLLDQVVVHIERSGPNNETLDIFVDFPDPDAGFTGASFSIRLPAGAALDLETENGAIFTSNNEGAVRARATNRFIVVEENVGDVDLETDNGGIEATQISGNVLARTGNGGIMVRASPPANGSVDLETTNGMINFRVPTNTAASLDLETTNGNITTDYAGFTVDNLQTSATHVTATLNGGGGTIHAKTVNGGIVFDGL